MTIFKYKKSEVQQGYVLFPDKSANKLENHNSGFF